MIKRETIKRTRDFLNDVRVCLSQINSGYINIQDCIDAHNVSKARFGAAVSVGLFEVVRRNGRRYAYRCTKPYINEGDAAIVIRHEYNQAERSKSGVPRQRSEGQERYNEKLFNDVIRWLRNNKFEGLLYRTSLPGVNDVKVVV